jgi:hypothetical protein
LLEILKSPDLWFDTGEGRLKSGNIQYAEDICMTTPIVSANYGIVNRVRAFTIHSTRTSKEKNNGSKFVTDLTIQIMSFPMIYLLVGNLLFRC